MVFSELGLIKFQGAKTLAGHGVRRDDWLVMPQICGILLAQGSPRAFQSMI